MTDFLLTRRDFARLFGAGLMVSGGLALPAFAGTPVKGGTLRIVAGSEHPSFVDLFGNGAIPAVQGELLTIDFDMQPHPSLAERWEISDDSKTFTFHLRKGVSWHDGTPFTAGDVAYSFETLRQTHPRRRNTFANLTAVETPDDHTVIARFSAPAPYLLGALSGVGTAILPRHIYEGTDLKTNPNNRKPIGTGPYIFKEWEQGSHYILERNPNHWTQDGAWIDRIIIRVIPDAAARAAALESGEVDLGFMSPVPYTDVQRFLATGQFGVETRGYELGGNLHQMFFNLDHPFLKHLKVRQAIAHALDIDRIIKTVWDGYAVPSAAAIVPDLKTFHDETIKHYPYDTALAEQLLDEAGFPRGGDGKRARLNLTWNPGMSQQKLAADYIRYALGEVGIEVTIQNYEFSTYIQKVYTERAFDIDVQNLNNGYDPTDGVDRAYLSTNIQKGLAWSNHTHYANPEVDALLISAAAEGDPVKRRHKYVEFQRIVHRDLPAVNLVQFQRLTVFNTRLKGHTEVAGRLGSDSFERYYFDA